MPALRVENVELFYEERGAGPTLAFLHGLGSSTRDWSLQLDHFSKRFRCLAFDLPGSGQSKDLDHPQGPFTVPGFARAVAGGLRLLGGAAHVVGLSMGGMTGLQLALDAPDVVRSLAVVNAVASVNPKTLKDKALLGLRGLLTVTLGPKGVARLVAPRLFPKPEHAALRSTFIEQLSQLEPVTYAAVSRAVMGWSVEDRVAQLAPPVLFVSADGDYTPIAAKQELVARIRGAKLVVVPDSHHALPVECPAPFNAVIDEWLTTFSPA